MGVFLFSFFFFFFFAPLEKCRSGRVDLVYKKKRITVDIVGRLGIIVFQSVFLLVLYLT